MIRPNRFFALIGYIFLAGLWITACDRPQQTLYFGGGAKGGTIQRFAEAMAQVIDENRAPVQIKVEPSGGANINLTRLANGKLDMAIVYASDLISTSKSTPPLRNVMALARLYGPTAQLVVMADSPVETPYHLANQRVAIGPPGSDSALSAERYFKSIDIWETLTPLYIGPDQALRELSSYQIGAVWQLIGFPSESIEKASYQFPIRLINLLSDTQSKDFFNQFPFYSPRHIPAGTYRGQTKDVAAFQDNAIWVANSHLDADVIYGVLKALFSENGLARLRALHPVAWDINADNATTEVGVPLHPGAIKYWRESGRLF